MIPIKYDTLAAVQCDYLNFPHEVLADMGYTTIAFSKTNAKYRLPAMIFFEVEHVFEPLPAFLEKSEIWDGRFDPRYITKRVMPDPIQLVDQVIQFQQDATTYMSEDFEPKGSTSSIAEEEKAREDVQGIKAKRSSNTKK